MTVITSHGPGAVEKKTYCAKPGYKIVEFDYQAADTRGVAGYSGDTEFLKLTDKDADPHEITARLIFGDSVYDRSLHRQRAKPVTHASAYNAGAETLARTAKLPVADMETFLRNRKRKYPKLYRWNERVIEEGRRGFITTAWGRKLKVDPRKSFTQSPAQYGQNCTREIVTDALIRMARKDVRLIQWLIIQVHDALAFEIPEEHLVWAVPMIKDCMETWFDPPGGQRVHFPVEHGKPSDNWYDAGH
jgi:DNA polymerase I-like protein with 3'-5' exonuclease and polymerase domains